MTEVVAPHVDMLQGMFPNIDSGVIGMILDSVNNNVEKASDLLLDMSSDGTGGGSAEGEGGGGAASAGGSGDPGAEEAWPSPSWAAARAKADVASPRTKSLTAIGAKMGGCNEDKVFQDCLQDLQNNKNVMVILRGLPGSGKSTMAKRYEMSDYNKLFKIHSSVGWSAMLKLV